ncbi:MAG TPA: hypothetical protein VM571_06665 [Noviherbaspirillum sp.]|jgi:biotin transporter BioY|nr:hypothetical protein [Noviherbaspirillum sp.]
MYIVAIAWLYVVMMMSITEQTATAGVMTFLFYGILPLTVILYLMGTPRRKHQRTQQAQELLQHAKQATTDSEKSKTGA